MSYYHIDTLQRYIQSLGFKNINNRSIKVNVNGTTDDNSFYSPSTKALTFGTGGVDDAEDAGIIAHEYGHSIQDNQVPGFGSSAEGGAMGEGFGDFLVLHMKMQYRLLDMVKHVLENGMRQLILVQIQHAYAD